MVCSTEPGHLTHPWEAPLGPLEKGVPGHAGEIPLDQVGERRWSVLAEDLPLPVAVIKTSALRHNSAWMKDFAERYRVGLAPNGKTTLCPALFDLQLADGAWGISLATPHQLQIARRSGYRRILLANQLIGKSAIEWVIEELRRSPDFEFYCLVDSSANVEQLALIARRRSLSRPLRVLVEMGFEGGRTGCRTVEQAVSIAGLVAKNSDVLALRGVEGYEGIIRERTDEVTVARVDSFLDSILACAQECVHGGYFADGEVLLTAGGSAFFDRVSAKLSAAALNRTTLVLLRGGCYLTHDSVLYARSFEKLRNRASAEADMGAGLLPALEVWAYVQSTPEPGLAIAAMGKRDVSFEEMPMPLKWYRPGGEMSAPIPVGHGYSVSRLNDQHCYLNVPNNCELRVGDMVGFGISHPCLTFDKWRVLHLIDDTYRVTGSVRTYF
ncbi:MAG TPA: amino acid deaminase [Steroidobacteraceae bacterium]|jgi:D-serine dehydratase